MCVCACVRVRVRVRVCRLLCVRIFTCNPAVSYAIMGGYGASRTSTAAAFGSLLLDHFGMLHYTVRQAGFSSNIKTTLVRSLPSKAVDTEITSDFSGPLVCAV